MDRYLIIEQDLNTNMIIIKKMLKNYSEAFNYLKNNYSKDIKIDSLNILKINNMLVQIVPINEKKFNFKMEANR